MNVRLLADDVKEDPATLSGLSPSSPIGGIGRKTPLVRVFRWGMTCECACLVCGRQMDRAKAHRADRTCSPVCAELVRWLPYESCGWPAQSNNASRRGHRPGHCILESFGPPPELAAWRQARVTQERARERRSEACRRARAQRTARRRALVDQASPKRDPHAESHRDDTR